MRKINIFFFLFLSIQNCKSSKWKVTKSKYKYIKNAAIENPDLLFLYISTWVIKIIFAYMGKRFAEVGWLAEPTTNVQINRKALFVYTLMLFEYVFSNISIYIEIKLKQYIENYASKDAISACCKKKINYLDECNKAKLMHCILNFSGSVADGCIQRIKFYANLCILAIISYNFNKESVVSIFCAGISVLAYYSTPYIMKDVEMNSVVEDLIDNMKMVHIYGENNNEKKFLLKICNMESKNRARVNFCSQFLKNLRLLDSLNGLIATYILLLDFLLRNCNEKSMYTWLEKQPKLSEAHVFIKWFAEQAYIYSKLTGSLTNMIDASLLQANADSNIVKGLTTILEGRHKEGKNLNAFVDALKLHSGLKIDIVKPFEYEKV